MKKRLQALLSGVFALHCVTAAADFGDGQENLSPSRVLANQDGRFDHFKGIGRIRSDESRTCSAVLIDTRTSNSSNTAPAYVLTSGHCLQRPHDGVIITDQPVNGTVTFNYFADTIDQQQPYALSRINWSSMQGVDLAIVELQAPLQSLIDAGITPLRLAEQAPAEGTDILIVGAPIPFKRPYLRLAACTHQLSAQFIEHPWVWRHTVKNQCKDLKEGSSGSPALIRDSNEVFAVMNTTTPQDGSFGNPISYLRSCFVDGLLTTDPERCPLFPTFSVQATEYIQRYAKVKRDAQGNERYPSWNVAFSIDKPFYRFKTARDAIQCEDPNDYSPVIEASNARINAPIGPQSGVHLLCLIGVESADERPSPGLMRNALTFATELQAAGPAAPAQVKFSQRAGRYLINWDHDPRLITKQTFKVGPVQTTDCNDPAGYNRAWRKIILPAHKLPVKVCTYAFDHADQQSEVREDVLEAGGV